jgi:hypothetical protein
MNTIKLRKPGEQFKVILTFGKNKMKIIHTVERDNDNDSWRLKGIYYNKYFPNLGYPDKVSVYYISNMQTSFPNRKK